MAHARGKPVDDLTGQYFGGYKLEELVDVSKTDKTFPGAPNHLMKKLNEIKPNLAGYGLSFEKAKTTSKGVHIKIQKLSSLSSLPSEFHFFNELNNGDKIEGKDDKPSPSSVLDNLDFFGSDDDEYISEDEEISEEEEARFAALSKTGPRGESLDDDDDEEEEEPYRCQDADDLLRLDITSST